MNRKLMSVIVAAMIFGFPAAAGDVAAGEEKAQPCVTCHGVAGNKPIADYPKLAGQSRKYLLQVMREYRDGRRVSPVMSQQIGEGSDITDEDLQDLAAYYAAQPGDLR